MAVAATDTQAGMGFSSAQSLEAILASILAKIIAAPATEAKQDTIIAALVTANEYLAQIVTNTTPAI